MNAKCDYCDCKAEKQYFGKFMGANKKFEYLINE